MELLPFCSSSREPHPDGLFGAVLDGKCDIVLITHRDRLTRFGFEYIEYFFNRFGVRIEIAMDEEKSPREELVEDFIEGGKPHILSSSPSHFPMVLSCGF